MIGRDFAHSMFDQQTAEIPLSTFRDLIEDSALQSLTDDLTTEVRERWAKERPDFTGARIMAPDASMYLAWSLRWLLSKQKETASVAYGVIAYTALNRYGIPTAFTGGWLASNIRWGGGDPDALPLDVDIEAFIQAATTEEALRTL
ncbi:hypothetical protein ACFWJ4_16680 [Kitasatospora sp. NPDC127067]|uniref:hypothetical protein n=1 Tax=Kitasatospora sp. NPDC127067 TaxID=3347126 RepID=UPI00365D85D7